MLDVSGLSYGFGAAKRRPLFSNFQLDVAPGSLIHLVGANGVGKSTLLSVLTGLIPQQEGRIEFKVPFEFLAAETNGLLNQLGGVENLKFWLRLRGQEAHDQEVVQQLDVWGLNHPLLLAGLPVERYSTGMKRKLALARVCLSGAPLWILDEPCSGLDTSAIGVFSSVLQQHLGAGGAAVIVSHDPSIFMGNPAREVHLAKFS